MHACGPVNILPREVEGEGEGAGRMAGPGEAPAEKDLWPVIRRVMWGGSERGHEVDGVAVERFAQVGRDSDDGFKLDGGAVNVNPGGFEEADWRIERV